MKKYMIVMAAFLLTAGMVNAQTIKKTGTDNPAPKMSKATSTKKTTSSITAVSPGTTSTEKKTGTTAAIKRKHHHKKSKSVPASKK